MAASNRAALLSKTHRVLKKHYKPVVPPPERTLLEHLIFACCLENSLHADAESAYAALVEQFFDWNEVRVSSVRELAEVLGDLGDAKDAATRLKYSLQSVFESVYAFDLESFKKENIGQAVKKLQQYNGTTTFSVAYVKQAALGGHSIPVNDGALGSLTVIGIISEAEAEKKMVPGLERAISKPKGVEFGALLHQLGVSFFNNPYAPQLRKLLLEIAPDCKDRLPKRATKKSIEAAAKTAEAAVSKTKAAAKKDSAAKKGTAAKKKSATKKQPPAKKKTADNKKPAKKKAAAKKKTSTSRVKGKTKTKKKSSTSRLSKRKPR